MLWIRSILLLLGALAGLIAVIGVWGALLPVRHSASRAFVLRANRITVWTAIRDFEASPEWRSDLKRVEHNFESIWIEVDNNGERIAYETTEEVSARRLVRAIASKDLPFGGKWTFDLSDRDEGCAVVLTEDGEVYNPFFRFLSRFVFGHHATMDRYIADLRRHVETS